MKKIDAIGIIIVIIGLVAILKHYVDGWDKFFGFQSSFLAVLFSFFGIMAVAGVIGFWLWNRWKGEIRKNGNCPNPRCGAKIETSFSREEKLMRGKNLICPQCKGLMWFSFKGKPKFFPNTTDQYGQARQLRC